MTEEEKHEGPETDEEQTAEEPVVDNLVTEEPPPPLPPAPIDPVVVDEPPPLPPARPGWARADSIALILILIACALLRFVNLSDPPDMIFDEVYYAKDACHYVLNTDDPCGPKNNEVHPTVGKWLIGAGIKVFDFDSFGWRVVPAIAGILTVALMYLIARRLFGSWIWAAIAAGLLTIDPLHFVQSRTSMLDIFLPLFGLAAVLFLLKDRDRILGGPRQGWFGHRPWRIAAGVAVGVAISTKWTGAFFLALVLLLSFVWETTTREGSLVKRVLATMRREAPSLIMWLIVLPLIIYVVSWTGQIQGKILATGDGSWIKGFLDHHRYMWDFHTNLTATHGYQSPPWSWILIKRPVSYFFCAGEACSPPIASNGYSEIFATGSPLVWWTSIVAIFGLAGAWIVQRKPRGPEGVVLAGVALTYGPWLIPGADRPAVFIFYLLPTVPFMILALVYWMHRINITWEGKAATALFVAGSTALFVFYYPLLAKRPLPQPQWQQRIWIFDKCDKPEGPLVTNTITVTENGKEKETTSEAHHNGSLPPTSWCWI